MSYNALSSVDIDRLWTLLRVNSLCMIPAAIEMVIMHTNWSMNSIEHLILCKFKSYTVLINNTESGCSKRNYKEMDR